MLTRSRQHLLSIVLAVAVPALMFCGMAWWTRRIALQEGRYEIVRTIANLRDEVQLVFEAERRALVAVDAYIDHRPWDELGTSDVTAFLRALVANTAELDALWIADPRGIVVASTIPLSAPNVRAPEHDILASGEPSGSELYIAAAVTGTPPAITSIDVVRRRLTPDGQFDGSIHASLNQARFSQLFQVAAPLSDETLLVRSDGGVLARNAPDTTLHPDATQPLFAAIRTGSNAGSFVAGEEIYSYLRVPGYPVYVSLGVKKAAILQHWSADLMYYGLAALAAAAALVGLSLLAVAREKSEHEALVRLRIEAERRLDAETQLATKRHMEAIGRLTAGIAHAFNNLLAVLLGSLELLRIARTEASRQEILQRAQRAAERGARITGSLLAFGGQQLLRVEKVNANAVLEDLLTVLRGTLGSNTQFEVVKDEAIPEFVADRARLEAALMDIVLNAVDAMPRGGTVTISTRITPASQLSLTPEAGDRPWISISVRDTGIGLLVHQLGGQLSVESRLGEGTTVTLHFPPAAPANP
jgi:signal transduction histidine kinase